MKILVQRVKSAKVEVENTIVGEIGIGVLVFVGITHNDTKREATWLANKLLQLRFFLDEEGKMNRSLLECKGQLLVVSQFTLYADCTSGRRPSFTQSASPELAQGLYDYFIAELRNSGLPVATGLFGAKMQVSLTNDGPVTFMLER